MELTRTIQEVRATVRAWKRQSGSMGFVPTMGSLHEGHLSLVKKSLQENRFTAVSIFVNPTQFNDQQDFVSYPRDLEGDLAILLPFGVDLVFAPTAGEIYPEPDTREFDFGGLDRVMEGKYRPGHFKGVVQVVSRLFSILEPGVAYFGEKDFQQMIIIRKMVEGLQLPVRIESCPIIREPDGLAMSSRNRLLTAGERRSAARIPQALALAKAKAGKVPVKTLLRETLDYLHQDPDLKVEYFEIVDSTNLQPIGNWNFKGGIRACIAVRAGRVRLIDNMDFSL